MGFVSAVSPSSLEEFFDLLFSDRSPVSAVVSSGGKYSLATQPLDLSTVFRLLLTPGVLKAVASGCRGVVLASEDGDLRAVLSLDPSLPDWVLIDQFDQAQSVSPEDTEATEEVVIRYTRALRDNKILTFSLIPLPVFDQNPAVSADPVVVFGAVSPQDRDRFFECLAQLSTAVLVSVKLSELSEVRFEYGAGVATDRFYSEVAELKVDTERLFDSVAASFDRLTFASAEQFVVFDAMLSDLKRVVHTNLSQSQQ